MLRVLHMPHNMSQVRVVILVICFFLCGGEAQAPAPPPANDGLLLPVALGFLLKVVLVVLGGMVKLLFLGFTSLGTSGLALLLGILFLKNHGLSVPPWPAHVVAPAHGWHDRNWRLGAAHRWRNAKQMHPMSVLGLYKPEEDEYNGEHPVPVVDELQPLPLEIRPRPHHWTAGAGADWRPTAFDEMESATFSKQTPKLAQTHALAN